MSEDTGKCCTKCGERKPLTEFYPSPASRAGLRASCKACDLAYQRQVRAADSEQYRERKRKAQRRYAATHPEYQQDRWRQLRDTVFGHYGRTCACCGATGDLSIDHVGGGGREHRLEVLGSGNASGTRFYLWLVRQGFPGGFQVLCLPCNQSKGSGPVCLLHNPRPHCPSCSCYSS